MTDQPQQNAEKYTSDEILDELLKQLNYNQLRYISIRQEYATDAEAAEAVGLKPNTIYHWPPTVNQALRLMAGDGVHVAKEMRRRALPKAMAVKVAGLDSKDEQVRQKVSTEIIEWELGRAAQRQEVTGKDGDPIRVVVGVGIDLDKL